MTKKKGDTTIGGIKSTKVTGEVEGTENVSSVTSVKGTSALGGVGKAGSSTGRRGTRVMTIEEREKLFSMVSEEAEKLFKNSGLPESKRSTIEKAVKMAIDSGLVDSDDSKKKK